MTATDVVYADLVEPNGRPNEGWWKLALPDPPRVIDVLILRLGDVRGEPWNFFGPDRVIGTHYNGTAATLEHALARVVGAAAWAGSPGSYPRHAVTGDSRVEDPAPTIEPLANAPHLRPEPGAKSTDRFAPTAIVPNAPVTATIGAADPGSVSSAAPSARAQQLAAAAQARRTRRG